MNGWTARQSRRNLAKQARSVALMLTVVFACMGTRPAPTLAASLDAEWAAVESVIAPFSPPQALLANVMNATGAEAIGESALLHLTMDQFVQYQSRHPAYLMNSIQGFLSQFWRGDASTAVLVIENVNSSTPLLNLNGLSPADEATLITKIVTGPRATSYLQATVQPTATPQAAQPVSTQRPLFPPDDAFSLRADQYGGPAKIVSLPATGFPSPTKPRSRKEYDVISSNLAYRVSIFNTMKEAQAAFRWQTGHLDASQVRHRSSADNLSGPIWEYTAGRYYVAAALYRNIEIATSAPLSPKTYDSVGIVEGNLLLAAKGYEDMLAGYFGLFPDTTPAFTVADTELMHLFKTLDWGNCIGGGADIAATIKGGGRPDIGKVEGLLLDCTAADNHIAALYGTKTGAYRIRVTSPKLGNDARVKAYAIANIVAGLYTFRWVLDLLGRGVDSGAALADLNARRAQSVRAVVEQRQALQAAYGLLPPTD